MEFNVLDIVYHILNIVVLFLLLRVLLYNPIRNYMKKREELYQKQRDDANALMKDAAALKAENEKRLEEAQKTAQQIAEEKMAYAEQVAEQKVDDAQKQAEQILSDARAQIRTERQEAQTALVDQTAALAVDLATRILGREINKSDNERLIDEYFGKVV